jgi:ADP-heptose:LPS heptosyltransferase
MDFKNCNRFFIQIPAGNAIYANYFMLYNLMYMANKTLIIKLGALGDVVRTTPLLRALKGEIDWVTSKSALPLLDGNPFIKSVSDIDEIPQSVKETEYDTVICLDEDARAATLAATVGKKNLVGIYMEGGKVFYTDNAREWMDMSLISRFGKIRADEIKKLNRKSYQEILFGMLGKKFSGEEYILPAIGKNNSGGKFTVGIENRAGERWVGKRWPHAEAAMALLERENIKCIMFSEEPSLKKFLERINEADVVVTTDTLTMHLALGLGKKTLAIFNVTSPWEIYGHGRLVKIVSPLFEKYFYSTEKTTEPGNMVKPEAVYNAVMSLKNNAVKFESDSVYWDENGAN